MHHHKIKEETFYVVKGVVLLETRVDGQVLRRIMHPGEIAHIAVGVPHRFTGIRTAEIIEFSTYHREDDSYRDELAGAVDLASLNLPKDLL